jgi:hypothetical protein
MQGGAAVEDDLAILDRIVRQTTPSALPPKDDFDARAVFSGLQGLVSEFADGRPWLPGWDRLSTLLGVLASGHESGGRELVEAALRFTVSCAPPREQQEWAELFFGGGKLAVRMEPIFRLRYPERGYSTADTPRSLKYVIVHDFADLIASAVRARLRKADIEAGHELDGQEATLAPDLDASFESRDPGPDNSGGIESDPAPDLSALKSAAVRLLDARAAIRMHDVPKREAESAEREDRRRELLYAVAALAYEFQLVKDAPELSIEVVKAIEESVVDAVSACNSSVLIQGYSRTRRELRGLAYGFPDALGSPTRYYLSFRGLRHHANISESIGRPRSVVRLRGGRTRSPAAEAERSDFAIITSLINSIDWPPTPPDRVSRGPRLKIDTSAYDPANYGSPDLHR